MLRTIVLVGFLLVLSNTFAFEIPMATTPPTIDGDPGDPSWAHAEWRTIDQLILGEQPSKDDFSGRYKLLWTENQLYMLAEIIDDVLIDKHASPLNNYWEDDALEILIDEDASGGDHLKNFNAFAYHIALDNQAVDINREGEPELLNDHVESLWKRDPDTGKVIWEIALALYDDDYHPSSLPLKLSENKEIGIMIAYCDADDLSGRQNFLTSYDIKAVDGSKNRAYIDADVFEKARLIK